MISPFSKYRLKNFLYGLPKLGQPNCFAYTLLLDAFVRKADAVTVVSERFRKKYGGELIYQYVDTATFDPSLFDRDGIRREEGLGDVFSIAFVGIALPNKGVENILKAMDGLSKKCRLWIIGPKTEYARELAARDGRVDLFGTRSPCEVPRFLAAADLVVLPQRKGPHSDGQMPIKLFEAMAMAKPIVATSLADIPKILSGCGLVVPPDDIVSLREALHLLAMAPDLAGKLGALARNRCLSEYSWERGLEKISGIFDPLIEKRRG
jgi:glycosyltransferase involved in cell wall biosynthesis